MALDVFGWMMDAVEAPIVNRLTKILKESISFGLSCPRKGIDDESMPFYMIGNCEMALVATHFWGFSTLGGILM